MNLNEMCTLKGYFKDGIQSWNKLADTLVKEVCSKYLSSIEIQKIYYMIREMKFIPAGRYLYYAGREANFYNNCFALAGEEDTREEWGRLIKRSCDCLMTGGGIGVVYDIFRAKGTILKRTGGVASGPIPLMSIIDNIGYNVIQGGSRRSACWGGLSWWHGDIFDFLSCKDWDEETIKNKLLDYNFKAPFDSTNISVIYDSDFIKAYDRGDVQARLVFQENLRLALKNGEPGFSFNLQNKAEKLRNAPVAGGTNVLTSKGYQQVKDVLEKEIEVWTGYRWAKTRFVRTKRDTATMKVIIGGHRNRSITCDPEHEFKVVKFGNRIVDVPARDLKIGDRLFSKMPDSVGIGPTFLRVEGLEDDIKQDVFCCDVKVEEHSFLAEGVVISNCCELVSEDDSEVCNLGSLNLSRIEDTYELERCSRLALKFLMCGALEADLPYSKVDEVRDKNNRIGLGLMGVHEWLIQRGYSYSYNEELENWLCRWQEVCNAEKYKIAECLKCTVPVATRLVAPTGTISQLPQTTQGAGPIFAKAYKRRFLKENKWHYNYIIDATYDRLKRYPTYIESASEISIENRLEMLDLLGAYVDMAVSDTINLPKKIEDETELKRIENLVIKYVKQENIRGLTFYPNGARGSILEECSVDEVVEHGTASYEEVDVCDITKGGSCG